MAVKVRLEFLPEGFSAILNAKATQDDALRRAEAIAGEAGEGFTASTWTGRTRVFAGVRAVTMDARRAEAVDKVLTAAIDAGR